MERREVLLCAAFFVLVATGWKDIHLRAERTKQSDSAVTTTASFQAATLQPVSSTRFNVDELILCVDKLGHGGWEISRDEKTGVVMRFVVVSPGIELRLEKGIEVLGAYVVTDQGEAMGWKRRAFDPDEDTHVLGENDFYPARDKVLAECRARSRF